MLYQDDSIEIITQKLYKKKVNNKNIYEIKK